MENKYIIKIKERDRIERIYRSESGLARVDAIHSPFSKKIKSCAGKTLTGAELVNRRDVKKGFIYEGITFDYDAIEYHHEMLEDSVEEEWTRGLLEQGVCATHRNGDISLHVKFIKLAGSGEMSGLFGDGFFHKYEDFDLYLRHYEDSQYDIIKLTATTTDKGKIIGDANLLKLEEKATVIWEEKEKVEEDILYVQLFGVSGIEEVINPNLFANKDVRFSMCVAVEEGDMIEVEGKEGKQIAQVIAIGSRKMTVEQAQKLPIFSKLISTKRSSDE